MIAHIIANFLLLLVSKLILDSWLKRMNVPIQHGIEILFVAIQVALFAIAVTGWNWHLVGLLGLQMAAWWILFDLGWNITHRMPLFYIGNTAALDRLFYGTKHGEHWMLAGKGLLLIVSYIVYVIV